MSGESGSCVVSPVCIDELLCLVHDLDDEGVHADHLLEDGSGQGGGAT